jgi:hypothetical protein
MTLMMKWPTSASYRLTRGDLREPALSPCCWDRAGMRLPSPLSLLLRGTQSVAPARASGAGINGQAVKLTPLAAVKQPGFRRCVVKLRGDRSGLSGFSAANGIRKYIQNMQLFLGIDIVGASYAARGDAGELLLGQRFDLVRVGPAGRHLRRPRLLERRPVAAPSRPQFLNSLVDRARKLEARWPVLVVALTN